ncbi:hypothetical protein, partial [uncultured Winogradskyella sp.]|uniref:leucine-rich repeat domain-containing protein n=1 Tax=uncultured Winogradskyella sp. TaxID=395353 RepID=UPI00260876CC
MKQTLFLFTLVLSFFCSFSQCPNNNNTDSDGDGVVDCIDPCTAIANSIIGNLSFESDLVGWTIPQNQANFTVTQDASNTLHGTKGLYVTAPNAAQFENHAIFSEEFTLEEGIGYSFRIPAKRIGNVDGDALRWALVDENGVYRHLNNYYDWTTDWVTINIDNLQIDLTNFTSNRFRFRLEFGLSQTDMVVDRIEFFETNQGFDPLYQDTDGDGNPDCVDNSALVPLNDSVIDATELTSLNYFESNIRLDLSDVNNEAPIGCNTVGFSGIYYKFTANVNTTINASILAGSGSNIVNSFVIVYTAQDLNATSMSELTHLPASACAFGTESVFPITAGQSYYIMVHRSDANALTSFAFFEIEDVPQTERDALIAFYNDSNGATWNNNSNWTTVNPVATWFGVTVSNINGEDHVTEVKLTSNNLNGTINTSLNQLSELENLWLFNNTLSGTVPDFSTLPNLQDYLIDGNQFSFEDLEPNFSNNNSLSNFRYSPQQTITTPVELQPTIGEDLTITMTPIDGTNVVYQWYKTNNFDQNPTDGIINGETSNTLSFNPIQLSDLDTYQCWATSPLIPDLTYRSAFYDLQGEVSQQEKDALTAFYNALGGDNWVDNTNWLSNEPVSTWSHITTSGNKVIGIDIFGDGNWVGQIPEEIGSLTNLEYLGIALNPGVTGEIPINIGNLNNLERLRIQSVPLTGTFPTTIGNLSNLRELRVIATDMTGELPSEIGNLTNLRDLTLFGSGVFGGLQDFTGSIPSTFGNLSNLAIFDIRGNSFSGQIPSSLSNLSNLSSFLISFNELSGSLPDFSANTNSPLFFILENNFFDFSDLEPLINNGLNYNTLTYSPQGTVDEAETIESGEGSNITLTVTADDINRNETNAAQNNQFQWFKDNAAITGA